MSEVGALIVRLQAETAQFRSDMGKVKSDLDGLKGSTESLGNSGGKSFSSLGGSAGGLRNQIGLLDNAIRGAHAQAMADLIRKFSDTEIVMKLLPLAATGAAFVVMGGLAVMAVEKVVAKLKEMKEKIEIDRETQNSFNGTIGKVFGDLNDKLLQAGIKADEFSNNHLGALRKQLELIDHQSMKELGQQFDVLSQAADKVFATLQSHWYELGSGSDRAKHDLQAFQSQYEMLLSTGKKDEANKLLQDRVTYEQHILSLANEIRAAYSPMAFAAGDYLTKDAAKINELKQAGAGITDKEIKSQQNLVDILNSQVTVYQKIAETANIEKNTDTGEVTKKINLEKLKSWDEAAKVVHKYTDAVTAANAASERHSGHAGPSAEELAAIAQIDPLMAQALSSTKQENGELDKFHAYLDQIAEAEKNVAKAQEDQNSALKNDAIERQIEAYQRLASEGLISQQQLVAKLKPLYQEQTDDKIAAIKSELQQVQALELAAQTSGDAVKADRAKADEIRLQTQLEQIRQKGIAQQASLNIKQEADFQKMANQDTQVWNSAITNWIVNGGRFSDAMRRVGATVLTDAINYAVRETIAKEEQWALQKVKKLLFGAEGTAQTIIANKTEATSAAGLAGANMMATVAAAPWPIDMTAPAQAAAAMSAAMGMAAFETGGKIPGTGAVPILGHGGETVVTKALTDRVEASEGKGSAKGGGATHYHFNPSIQAFDAEGVDRVLANHGAKFQRHITSVIRKMNR